MREERVGSGGHLVIYWKGGDYNLIISKQNGSDLMNGKTFWRGEVLVEPFEEKFRKKDVPAR